MIKNIFLAIVLCFANMISVADEVSIKDSHSKYVLGFIFFEALAGVNSWMASESPNLYGGVTALLFPIAMDGESTGKLSYWSTFVAAESLALYNLTLDEDKYSQSEIFKNNMLAWNIFAAVVATSSLIENKWFNQDSVKFIPANGGGHIAFNYRF